MEKLVLVETLTFFNEDSEFNSKIFENLENFVENQKNRLIEHIGTLSKDKILENETTLKLTDSICLGLSCLLLLSIHFGDFKLVVSAIELLDNLTTKITNPQLSQKIGSFVGSKVSPVLIKSKELFSSSLKLPASGDCTLESFFRSSHISIK